MPVIFLLGFGSVFRSSAPLLLGQMGQILTITILGGACLGMPTALVAERERGVWRRYQLLPVPKNALLLGVLLVRVIIVALAVLLQLGLARWIYGTPFPLHPVQFAGAFLVVTFAFLGLGLVVASLAKDVPAVQALEQCLFLPMILIGGVGVRLVALREWAQGVASFMPGRYAVEELQACFDNPHGLRHAGFPLAALVVIGAAAGIAGVKLLRWDHERRLGGAGRAWVCVALLGWASVGAVALATRRTAPIELTGAEPCDAITPTQIESITYDMLPPDDGIYTPLAPPASGQRQHLPPRLAEFVPRLATWPRGNRTDIGQSVRNFVSVAAIADITQDRSEREIARAVFDRLRGKYPLPQLTQALAWIILRPDDGAIVTAASELGLRGEAAPEMVRERSGWYARKFLGRLLGKTPDKPAPGSRETKAE